MKIEWGKILTSKLVWLGILEVLIGIFGYAATLPEETRISAAIAGILTVIFRFLTKDQLIIK
jgi:hypothetical protein